MLSSLGLMVSVPNLEKMYLIDKKAISLLALVGHPQIIGGLPFLCYMLMEPELLLGYILPHQSQLHHNQLWCY
jgi:hypothetical protein